MSNASLDPTLVQRMLGMRECFALKVLYPELWGPLSTMDQEAMLDAGGATPADLVHILQTEPGGRDTLRSLFSTVSTFLQRYRGQCLRS